MAHQFLLTMIILLTLVYFCIVSKIVQKRVQEAGVFGFSKVMPYFMGAFYWIAFIVLLVTAFSLIYIKVANKKK